MKRGTGLSQARKLGESRGRAPRGERAPSLTLPRKREREEEEGARRDERETSGDACRRARGIYPRAFRRSASPFVAGGESKRVAFVGGDEQSSDAN